MKKFFVLYIFSAINIYACTDQVVEQPTLDVRKTSTSSRSFRRLSPDGRYFVRPSRRVLSIEQQVQELEERHKESMEQFYQQIDKDIIKRAISPSMFPEKGAPEQDETNAALGKRILKLMDTVDSLKKSNADLQGRLNTAVYQLNAHKKKDDDIGGKQQENEARIQQMEEQQKQNEQQIQELLAEIKRLTQGDDYDDLRAKIDALKIEQVELAKKQETAPMTDHIKIQDDILHSLEFRISSLVAEVRNLQSERQKMQEQIHDLLAAQCDFSTQQNHDVSHLQHIETQNAHLMNQQRKTQREIENVVAEVQQLPQGECYEHIRTQVVCLQHNYEDVQMAYKIAQNANREQLQHMLNNLKASFENNPINVNGGEPNMQNILCLKGKIATATTLVTAIMLYGEDQASQNLIEQSQKFREEANQLCVIDGGAEKLSVDQMAAIQYQFARIHASIAELSIRLQKQQEMQDSIQQLTVNTQQILSVLSEKNSPVSSPVSKESKALQELSESHKSSPGAFGGCSSKRSNRRRSGQTS